jgi:hypothetical protein
MTEEVQNNPEPIKPSCYDQTTFNIEIQSVKTVTVGNLQNVVQSIKWMLVGQYNDKAYGLDRVTEFQDQELQDLQNFVSYENLAKEVVQGWIEARTPMLHLEYTICNQIAAAQTQAVEQPALPWSN